MSRQIARLALLCTASLMGLTGCGTSARYVTTTSNSGVVAIPGNSNSWPSYYHNQAEELIKAKCGANYVIELEEEFVTGTTQHTTSTTDTTGDPLLAAVRIAPVTQRNSQSTTFNNQTEWRIYYRRTDAPNGAGIALKTLPPGDLPPMGAIRPAVSLTPSGTPLPSLPTPLVVGPMSPVSGRSPMPGVPGS
jgi:hypothetical protein